MTDQRSETKLAPLSIVCGLVCAVGFPAALWLAFFRAPLMDELYFSQKIFYFHVPAAFMMFVAVFVCGIWSILYLRGRQARHDEIAHAGAELAVLFGAVVLATGSIWGKAAWNVWWQWDARLTSALLLWLIMLAYLLVRAYSGPGFERLAAGIAIFGMADVPLIYGSVNIWRTIHPETSVVPGLQGTMRVAFWVSVIVFVAFFVLLLQARLAVGRGERLLAEAREHALDSGLIE
jgi:heme exporter protein C